MIYGRLWSLASARHVATFQRWCGLTTVDGKLVPRSKLAFWTFTLGSKLGYELFYTLAFSSCFWNFDSWLCRRLMLVWAVLMYVGQAAKEIIKISRPIGHDVIVLEPEYSLEYGLPSTHAVLALSMPIALAFHLTGRYEFSALLFVLGAIAWCALICLSRLYLGMHSVLDIIAGLALTSLLIGPILHNLDWIDHFLMHSSWSPVILLLVISIAGALYPEPRPGSPSRGDTCTIISGSAGVYLGSWTLLRQGVIRELSPSQVSLAASVAMNNAPLYFVMRTLVGLALMAATRVSGKALARAALRQFPSLDSENVHNRYKARVEVPTKLVTYTLVGFSLAYAFVPFNLLSIGRLHIYYEG